VSKWDGVAVFDMRQTGGIGRHQGWTAVGLLALLYSVSLLDRLILAVLADPISKSIHLSDSQIGFVAGTGFAVLYSLASLPLAQLVDTQNRTWLVISGVSLWSAMTIGSGFATDFTGLLIARSGVALGEAVLVPATVSLIGDLFVKEKRTLPITVFSSIAAIISPLSFTVGGGMLLIASERMHLTGFEPWRMTFVLVGLPGLVLAFLFYRLVKEPYRQGGHASAISDASLRTFLELLFQALGLLRPVVANPCRPRLLLDGSAQLDSHHIGTGSQLQSCRRQHHFWANGHARVPRSGLFLALVGHAN
jgi:MFS family permease